MTPQGTVYRSVIGFSRPGDVIWRIHRSAIGHSPFSDLFTWKSMDHSHHTAVDQGTGTGSGSRPCFQLSSQLTAESADCRTAGCGRRAPRGPGTAARRQVWSRSGRRRRHRPSAEVAEGAGKSWRRLRCCWLQRTENIVMNLYPQRFVIAAIKC